MSSKTLLTLLAGATLSLSAAACNPADNTNANANANRAANANATATPTATATPAGSAYNRNYNSRTEFNANGYIAEAKNAGVTIGQGAEDGWIHVKVRAALAAVDDLTDTGINVDVDNNVVTLRGSVPTAAEKTKAQDAARKVEGVKSVTNKLEVKPDGSSGNANSGAANANKK